MSYLDNIPGYSVEFDIFDITEDTMTDTGVRVGDLSPIEDCSLTPGDPSPIGRTEDGDLAYVINPKRLHVPMTATQAADLIMTLATPLGLTTTEDLDYNNDAHKLILTLLAEAVNPVMFGDSAHGQLEATSTRNAVLTKGAEALPDWF